MPARKRAREVKRRLRGLVAEAERRDREAFAAALVEGRRGFLDDAFWTEHESWTTRPELRRCMPDDDCYFYCPHNPYDRAEVEEHLREEDEHERTARERDRARRGGRRYLPTT